MKYAIIIPAGAVDEACPQLDGRSPLEAAELPALDRLAARGRLGTAATIPAGLAPRSEVALLSVLGYNPQAYPVARGPLEAAARGLAVGAADQVFRCNLVTVANGRLIDFTAGGIDSPEAEQLLSDLNAALEDPHVRFYPGRGFRHLFVWEGAGPLTRLEAAEPQFVLDEPIARHLPRGAGAEPLRQLIQWSQHLLDRHDVNVVRRDLGENTANCVWLYGHGPLPALPPYRERFGLKGALVAGTDLMRGLGQHVGWEVYDVPGATGLLVTDLAAKGRAAVSALDRYDLVCVHVEAADEASHAGNAAAKVRVLEAIDRQVVGPVLQRLEQEPAYRILAMPDHATPLAARRHSADPTIFALAGTGIESNRGEAFDEANAEAGELHVERAWELMEYFLRR